MPANIYRVTPEGAPDEEIAWLCDGEWLLSPQVDALSNWLEARGAALEAGEYVADIGFRWRRSARAGGPILHPATMKRMADLGMSLFLSEYPGFADELEPGADLSAPLDSRPPLRLPTSPGIRPPGAQRTPSSGGCG